MNEKTIRLELTVALLALLLFDVLVLVLMFVDVRPIGPMESKVGLATLNAAFQKVAGYQEQFYRLSTYAWYASLGVAALLLLVSFGHFAVHRGFDGMDKTFLFLPFFLLLVGVLYLVFNQVVLNFSPVVLRGGLSPSFPGQSFVLGIVSFGSAIFVLHREVGIKVLQVFGILILSVGLGGTIVLGVLSGTYWLTDILGGIFLGGSVLFFYVAMVNRSVWKKAMRNRKRRQRHRRSFPE